MRTITSEKVREWEELREMGKAGVEDLIALDSVKIDIESGELYIDEDAAPVDVEDMVKLDAKKRAFQKYKTMISEMINERFSPYIESEWRAFNDLVGNIEKLEEAYPDFEEMLCCIEW